MLETKSHGYKKDSLARIFLINNYNYILKNIQNSKLSEMISGDIGPKFNEIIKAQINTYMQSWNNCVLSLMDVTYVKDGSIKTSLNKSQKQTIKESFKVYILLFYIYIYILFLFEMIIYYYYYIIIIIIIFMFINNNKILNKIFQLFRVSIINLMKFIKFIKLILYQILN